MLGLGYWGENDRLNMKFGRCNLFFPSLIPVAISVVLSCLFVHYLCIIRQTIIPLCFASVVQMLTGNESPQRPVKGTCYYQTAIHSQPIRDESITFEKSCAEREKLFIRASAAQRNISVFIRSQSTFFFFLTFFFWSESIKNSSHSLTLCYVPSLCDSVVFRSFLTSGCLSLFGSGDRSTCSTLLLPWKYPGHLSALWSSDSSVFLFFPHWASVQTTWISLMTSLMCTHAANFCTRWQ